MEEMSLQLHTYTYDRVNWKYKIMIVVVFRCYQRFILFENIYTFSFVTCSGWRLSCTLLKTWIAPPKWRWENLSDCMPALRLEKLRFQRWSRSIFIHLGLSLRPKAPWCPSSPILTSRMVRWRVSRNWLGKFMPRGKVIFTGYVCKWAECRVLHVRTKAFK